MDNNLLPSKITNEKVSPDSYSLNGGRLNEAYCLNEANGQWEVLQRAQLKIRTENFYNRRRSLRLSVFAADLKTTIRIYFF